MKTPRRVADCDEGGGGGGGSLAEPCGLLVPSHALSIVRLFAQRRSGLRCGSVVVKGEQVYRGNGAKVFTHSTEREPSGAQFQLTPAASQQVHVAVAFANCARK